MCKIISTVSKILLSVCVFFIPMIGPGLNLDHLRGEGGKRSKGTEPEKLYLFSNQVDLDLFFCRSEWTVAKVDLNCKKKKIDPE